MMHLEPHLVSPLETAGDGKAKKYKIIGLKEGWVTAQRQWTKVTTDTGVGNPALSTAEKGKVYLKAVTEKISEFFIQLERTALDDLYGQHYFNTPPSIKQCTFGCNHKKEAGT